MKYKCVIRWLKVFYLHKSTLHNGVCYGLFAFNFTAIRETAKKGSFLYGSAPLELNGIFETVIFLQLWTENVLVYNLEDLGDLFR